MKDRGDFVDWIKIGNYTEWTSGLYTNCIDTIGLLNSYLHGYDFNIEKNILDSKHCFLKQLNHEMLHCLLAKIEGIWTGKRLDHIKLRHELIDV